MKYMDGRDVRLGDRVAIGRGAAGTVVCCIDSGEFTDRFPCEHWEYLKVGVMIEFPDMGLVHYQAPDEDLKLIERAN